ncbi:GA4 desaturase [Stipitochalara longipes BDJ]|nr:GA4 desaturase [Stipitochalara longipes BDJ]
MELEESKLKTEAVVATFRYVAAGYAPKPSSQNFLLPALTEFGDERLLPLHSMRPIHDRSKLESCNKQLDTQGFTAINYPTTLHLPPYTPDSFTDPQLLTRYFVPEISEMLQGITGCKTVTTHAFILRAGLSSEGADGLTTYSANKAIPYNQETGFPQFMGFDVKPGRVSPSAKVHLDYSPTGARAHIRNFHPDMAHEAADIISHEEALLAAGKDLKDNYKNCGGPRWALYSVWMPLKAVKRDPLAVADYRTCKAEDYVPIEAKAPPFGRQDTAESYVVETFSAGYSKEHKWYWIDNQTPEEILIVRFFDSDFEGQGYTAGGGVLHSSVEIPGTESRETRESLETRFLCIW